MAQKCNSFILSINKYFLSACSVTGAWSTAANKAGLQPAFTEPTSYCTHFLPKWVDGWLKPTSLLYGQPWRGPRRYSSLSKSNKLSTIVWLVSCFSKHTLPTPPPQLSSRCLQCLLVHLACLNPLILSRKSPISSQEPSQTTLTSSAAFLLQSVVHLWVISRLHNSVIASECPDGVFSNFPVPFTSCPTFHLTGFGWKFLIRWLAQHWGYPWHRWGYTNHYSRAYIQRLSKSFATWKA